MEVPKLLSDLVSFAANIFTVCASAIAIYIFFIKGADIRSAFRLILNWSFQLTLTDLKTKLERLNEYNAAEPTDVDEIRNIFHEIAGQIRGNSKLRPVTLELVSKMEAFASGKNLYEPRKRALVSELRETLRNIEVNSLSSNDGVDNV